MTDDKKIFDSPEMKKRFENVMLSTDAMESILDMLHPNFGDVTYALAAITGIMLFKYVPEEKLEDVITALNKAARDTFDELKEKEELEILDESLGDSDIKH